MWLPVGPELVPMNCSYLSTKCEHGSILIPVVFTLKVQENLNNIVQVLSFYNTHYKTRKIFWLRYKKTKQVVSNIHMYIYTQLYRLLAIFNGTRGKQEIVLIQLDFRKCQI